MDAGHFVGVCARLLYPQSAKWVVGNKKIMTLLVLCKYISKQILLRIYITQQTCNLRWIKSNFNKDMPYACPNTSMYLWRIVFQKKISFSYHLYTSLGRSASANSFVKYLSLVVQMGCSQSRRIFSLYSTITGAFLQQLICSFLTIIGIIYSCVMLVTDCNNIIIFYPLIMCLPLIKLSIPKYEHNLWI